MSLTIGIDFGRIVDKSNRLEEIAKQGLPEKGKKYNIVDVAFGTNSEYLALLHVDESFDDSGREYLGKLAQKVTTALKKLEEQEREAESDLEEQRSLIESHSRFEEDLRIARVIQQGIIPKQPPEVEGYDIYGILKQSQAVGGDFYYFDQKNNTLRFVIADVKGKGVHAALVVNSLYTALKMHGGDGLEFMNKLSEESVLFDNDTTFAESGVITNVSMFYGWFDLDRHELNYINAGHPKPILFGEDGFNMELDEGGHLMGYQKRFTGLSEYPSTKVSLKPGDSLLIYTDGLYETTNLENEQFGMERLESSADNWASKSSRKMIAGLLGDVKRYTGRIFFDPDKKYSDSTRFFDDDMAAVAIKRLD
ncbi:MAG: SpoIIE family protein phosphatase [Nanoarchaeota archaeon]|nr:SpoIIE family protein phosphatase [Nanoarchaeota archaeon]